MIFFFENAGADFIKRKKEQRNKKADWTDGPLGDSGYMDVISFSY